MERRLPAGLSRDDEPLYLNLDFLDGTRGAHVNISGISGVATKTSYATFLLYSLFESGVLGAGGRQHQGPRLQREGRGPALAGPAQPPAGRAAGRPLRPRRACPSARSRAWPSSPRPGAARPRRCPTWPAATRGITSFFWTLEDFCRDELLPFLFADAEDDRQQYTMVVHNVTARLREAAPAGDGAVSDRRRGGAHLPRARRPRPGPADGRGRAGRIPAGPGPAIGAGTVNAFIRRLYGAVPHVQHLVRADVPDPGAPPRACSNARSRSSTCTT